MRITFLRPTLMTAAIVASAGILAGGIALRPAFAIGGYGSVSPDTLCNHSTPCKKYNNAGTGAGLQGINTNSATTGAGLLGTATSGGTGVLGQASSNNGVTGTSSSGIGVEGSSTSAFGVLGISNSSFGVEGETSSTSPSAAGIQGDNNATTIAVRANGFGGPLFDGNNSSSLDVFTVDNAGNTTILGNASVSGGSGTDALVAGNSGSFRGIIGNGFASIEGFGDGASPFGLVGFNNASGGGGEALSVQDLAGTGVLMTGFDATNNLHFELGDDGTVYAHAFVVAFDTPTGQKVTNYTTASTTPNVEDFGEAQLTAGQAYVSLKRTFGAEIDSRFAYMVFVTPEGDTRGLYVTQKTPAGFVVRENQGGRSDAAFSYRIVAKPYGSAVPAMRQVAAPPHGIPHLPTLATLHRVPKTKTKGF